MSSARKQGVPAMLAMVWLGLAPPADAQSARLPMRIVTYDYAGVEPAVIERARTVVSRVFGELGVDPAWMEAGDLEKEMPKDTHAAKIFVTSLLHVNVVSPAMHKRLGLRHGALGSAALGTRLIWVSLDNARQLAHWADSDLGDIVGYVIAHEIGHLLLPSHPHAVRGLMRNDIDPQFIAQGRLSFSPKEAALIRAAVASRSATIAAAAAR